MENTDINTETSKLGKATAIAGAAVQTGNVFADAFNSNNISAEHLLGNAGMLTATGASTGFAVAGPPGALIGGIIGAGAGILSTVASLISHKEAYVGAKETDNLKLAFGTPLTDIPLQNNDTTLNNNIPFPDISLIPENNHEINPLYNINTYYQNVNLRKDNLKKENLNNTNIMKGTKINKNVNPFGVRIAPSFGYGTTLDAGNFSLNEVNQLMNNEFSETPSLYAYGGTIHIKPQNRGKFTKYCGGKVTSECIKRGLNSNDPHVRQMANFARNARKWKKQAYGTTMDDLILNVDQNGGNILAFGSGLSIMPNTKNAEVEGGEVISNPITGQNMKVKGPTHEQGGVNINMPEQAEVFSDRIDATTGQEVAKGSKNTIADYINKANKEISKYNGFLEADPSNKIYKTILERLNKDLENKKKEFLIMQDNFKKQIEAKKNALTGKFAYGYDPFGNASILSKEQLNQQANNYFENNFTNNVNKPESSIIFNTENTNNTENSSWWNNQPLGNKIGGVASAAGTLADLGITIGQRLSDKPYNNNYAHVGDRAEKTIDAATRTLGIQRDLQLEDAKRQANAQRERMWKSSTSVNTARSLDDLVLSREQAAANKINSLYQSGMAKELNAKATTQLRADQLSARGATQAQLYNERQKDAFTSALHKDINTGIEQAQLTGKTFNQQLTNEQLVNAVMASGKYVGLHFNGKDLYGKNKETGEETLIASSN